jgi:hypothetical protein
MFILIYIAVVQTILVLVLLDRNRSIIVFYSIIYSQTLQFWCKGVLYVGILAVVFLVFVYIKKTIRERYGPYNHEKCPHLASGYVLSFHYDPRPVKGERACGICKEDFPHQIRLEHKIVCTPCKHMYCKNCLYKWLARQQRCPMCRDYILSIPNH